PRLTASSLLPSCHLRCQSILALTVGINPEGRRHVAVAKHLLHSLHACCSFPNEEARQAVAQVVEPETHLLSFFKHARLHRSRTEIVFEHVRDARLLTFEPGAGKNPVGRLGVKSLLLPLANETCE